MSNENHSEKERWATFNPSKEEIKAFMADDKIAMVALKNNRLDEVIRLEQPWSDKGFRGASSSLYITYSTKARLFYNAKLEGAWNYPDCPYFGTPEHEETDKRIKEEYEQLKEKEREYQIRSADQGSVEDQFYVGSSFHFGDNGYPIDYRKAMHYYMLAAEQGEARSINNIGSLYWDGKGVEQDLPMALSWYKRGFEAGNPLGMQALGNAYTDGRGVELNRARARECYIKAIELAQQQINMNPRRSSMVLRNNDTIRKCKVFVEELDSILLQEKYFSLGENRLGDAGDRIIYELMKMFQNGNRRAAFDLGYINNNRKNYQEAIKWYSIAGDRGFAGAYYNIGCIYYDGAMGSVDYANAYKYYNFGATQHKQRGCLRMLSIMYRNGQYVEKNPEKAFTCMKEAAIAGGREAYLPLGEMYEQGIGVAKNKEQAIAWYQKAVKEGINGAQNALSRLCF